MRGSSLAAPISRRKLRAQKFKERARSRTSVGSQPSKSFKENQEVEDFRVFQSGKFRMFRFVLLFLLDEFCKRGIESRGDGLSGGFS